MDLPSWDTARISLDLWLGFFGTATLEDATKPEKIDEFIAHLRTKGHSNSYISRVLSVGRAAINRAYKQGQIKQAPFIKDGRLAYSNPEAGRWTWRRFGRSITPPDSPISGPSFSG